MQKPSKRILLGKRPSAAVSSKAALSDTKKDTLPPSAVSSDSEEATLPPNVTEDEDSGLEFED